MDANSLFRAGQLNDAIAASLQFVKSNPLDVGGRLFLAELLCFQADWERAERQLETVTKQSKDDAFFALLVRQLICGEIQREQVFLEGRAPHLVGELPLDAKLQLEACTELRYNQSAAELIAQAEAARKPVSGVADDQSFSVVRDLDDRLAGVLEVITTTGKYYWVPWSSVKVLEFHPPERPVDLIWRKASIEVENGPEGDVFIPVRYPNAASENWDDQLRLGRATSWLGDEGDAVVGIGQRMLLIGEEAKAILDLRKITISTSETS